MLNAEARSAGKRNEKQASLPGDFLREGLSAVLAVQLREPEFEGQTKSRLGNPEVRAIVSEVVGEALSRQMQLRPRALAAIIDKATSAAKAAEAAKAARELVRRKTVLGSTVLPGKLAECASKRADDAEIFIVEGDSAGGSAKQGRQRQTQAVLPLRGKVLNVEKADDASMYANTEIQALLARTVTLTPTLTPTLTLSLANTEIQALITLTLTLTLTLALLQALIALPSPSP